jgi:ABC-type amino acid transport substrate-binding protein
VRGRLARRADVRDDEAAQSRAFEAPMSASISCFLPVLALAAGGCSRPAVPGLDAIPGFDGVRARGVLRVAAPAAASPLAGYDGLERALLDDLATAAGVPVTLVPAEGADLVGTVTRGGADMAIGQLAATPTTGVRWSVSYAQFSRCLVVPTRSTVQRLADLAGKRIAVPDDAALLRRVDQAVGAPYERVTNPEGGLGPLQQARADALVLDCPWVRLGLAHDSGRFKIASDTLDLQGHALAVRADDAALGGAVDAMLVMLGKAGELDRLASQWLGVSPPAHDYPTIDGRVTLVRPGEDLPHLTSRITPPESVASIAAANADLLGSSGQNVYPGLRLRLPP